MLGANVQAAVVPQHVGQGAAQIAAAALAAVANAVAGEAAAQGIAVIAMQYSLWQQAMVTGAVVEEQGPRPPLLRYSLFVRLEVGNGRFLWQRQGKGRTAPEAAAVPGASCWLTKVPRRCTLCSQPLVSASS